MEKTGKTTRPEAEAHPWTTRGRGPSLNHPTKSSTSQKAEGTSRRRSATWYWCPETVTVLGSRFSWLGEQKSTLGCGVFTVFFSWGEVVFSSQDLLRVSSNMHKIASKNCHCFKCRCNHNKLCKDTFSGSYTYICKHKHHPWSHFFREHGKIWCTRRLRQKQTRSGW